MSVNALYAGPFYGPGDKNGPDNSPYMRGVKRGLSRAGYLTWAQFDDAYNKRTVNAVHAFKADKKNHLTDKNGNVWGKLAHEALEKAHRVDGNGKATDEPALDHVALMLMEDGWSLKHPKPVKTNIEKVREAIAEYLEECIRYRSIIHYLQERPMRSLGVSPSHGFKGDCSELDVAACYWARTKTGIHVPDPSGYGFEGYGNTVSIYNTNRSRKLNVYGSFEVGDMALYGPYASRHTTICRVRGTAANARFTSHGSEVGPIDTLLRYRGDLFAVVRPILVP